MRSLRSSRKSQPILASLCLILALVLAACGGSGAVDNQQPPPEAGTLAVTVSGLPDGVAAGVSVSGPGGYSRSLTASGTLAELAPGSYTVTAAPATSGTDSYEATVTGSPAAVTAGATASVTVTYALQAEEEEEEEEEETTPGSLRVDITGLPEDTEAAVTVTGTDFRQVLTGSATLSDLEPGTYSVSVTSVVTETATYTGTVTGSPAEVSAGNTSVVTVTYALQEEEVTTGQLQLNVLGLPESVDAAITVTGPGDFEAQLTTTGLLQELEPGDYLVSATAVMYQGANYLPTVDTEEPEVKAGETTVVNVSYAPNETNDGDSPIKPAVFVHFNSSGTVPYMFDEPVFNSTPINVRGLQYRNALFIGDESDYLLFTQQVGDSPVQTIDMDLSCPAATPGSYVTVRVYNEADARVGQIGCDGSATLTIPASAGEKYLIHITGSTTTPNPYILSLDAHCFPACDFQPYPADE